MPIQQLTRTTQIGRKNHPSCNKSLTTMESLLHTSYCIRLLHIHHRKLATWFKRVRISFTVYAGTCNRLRARCKPASRHLYSTTLFIMLSVRIISYFRRAHRHQHPPPAKQPKHQRIHPPPVCGSNVQHDSTIGGHGEKLI